MFGPFAVEILVCEQHSYVSCKLSLEFTFIIFLCFMLFIDIYVGRPVNHDVAI